MAQKQVLIAGASVAGPVVAYWLEKAGCACTIVERAPELRKNGQSIDIRNDGVRIMRMMGIEEAVRAKGTSEQGLQFVNDSGKVLGSFGASGDPERQSFTSEFEIFRGDLAKILYDVTKDKIKYIFGDYIKSMTQNEKAKTVTVEFHNGTPTQTYDLVIGADGLNSKTRAMAFNTDVREFVKTLGAYTAYFTVDKDLLKGQKFCQALSLNGGRSLYLRPDPSPAGLVRAGMTICGPKDDKSHVIHKLIELERTGDQKQVKQVLADLFEGEGWVSKECIQGMMKSTDFYSGEIAQVYAPTLSRGRVAFIGDAGMCPSPMSGSGTTCGFVSAYVLAGEISKSLRADEDLDEALKHYDTEMIPRARKYQHLPPGIPQVANPQSQWGIYVLRTIVSLVSFLRIVSLVSFLSAQVSWTEGLGLPDYQFGA